MFAAPRAEHHDGWVRAARRAVSQVSAEEAAAAFLASSTSRRLDLRSALGSYAVARLLPEHDFELLPTHGCCAVCGQRSPAGRPQDLNLLNFERFKWGGTRRDHIEYVAFDLEQFARAPRLLLTRADIGLGRQLIGQLRRLPAATTAAQAAGRLPMIKGNKAERDVLMGLLGVCGILGTDSHPGHALTFIPYRDRALSGRRFIDQAYPACWWTAADGVNDTALHTFLPQLNPGSAPLRARRSQRARHPSAPAAAAFITGRYTPTVHQASSLTTDAIFGAAWRGDCAGAHVA